MIKLVFLEQLLPSSLAGEIRNHGNVEMVLPLRMESKDVVAGRSLAHGASDMVAGVDEGINNMCCHERVGASQEGGWHCVVDVDCQG